MSSWIREIYRYMTLKILFPWQYKRNAKKPLKENFMPVKYFPMGIIPVAHVINAPPASPRTKLKSVSTGLRMVAARIFGRATKDALLMPIMSMASSCWVIRMLPISEAMLDPILPARINATMVELNSNIMLSRTI